MQSLFGHAVLSDVARTCERFGVARLSVFGSVARGEQSDASDIDLLYVFESDAEIGFRLFELEDALSELFGRPVDLISERALHPLLRDAVLSEAVPLYAA
ncbi:MAG: nucleotidyltransferase family protein [Acidimicrobiia bacterium]|nr:nucleotidyltransferase family protein [Acidimicrobiia bacterium]MDH4306388.1 nucleotidyltransferase family protein [Acidimicrobiia bacterium]MDH5292138.1 nucleotidyltransferase family protein [Acidimicrobiia bacterium]